MHTRRTAAASKALPPGGVAQANDTATNESRRTVYLLLPFALLLCICTFEGAKMAVVVAHGGSGVVFLDGVDDKI
ncbi:hypothetical protein MRX96_004737 [Rhipicephalus microplus]